MNTLQNVTYSSEEIRGFRSFKYFEYSILSYDSSVMKREVSFCSETLISTIKNT